jgi:hypothetical protein
MIRRFLALSRANESASAVISDAARKNALISTCSPFYSGPKNATYVCSSLATVANRSADFEVTDGDLSGPGIHQIGFGEKTVPGIYKIVRGIASQKRAGEMTVGVWQSKSISQGERIPHAVCAGIHRSGERGRIQRWLCCHLAGAVVFDPVLLGKADSEWSAERKRWTPLRVCDSRTEGWRKQILTPGI